jgi:DNA-binding response OmpR family regulator
MIALYIDDDREDTEIFQEAIRSIEPDVVFYTASDGYEGFRVLEQITVVPDFIFLDVNMPRMNGKDFLTEIKKKIMFRSIPVIMYSTTSHQDEILAYKRMGAYDFIKKPDSFETLRQALKNIIRNRPKDNWSLSVPETK